MAKDKTTETAVNVTDFIHSFVDNEQKKADSFQFSYWLVSPPAKTLTTQ